MSADLKEWLTNVLHNNGYLHLEETMTDILMLLEKFPSMRPRTKVYTDMSGRPELLLSMYGSIPITIRNNQYRIPIELWIPRAYPVAPPLIYVTPTQNMVLQPGASVERDGRCHCPLLRDWQANSGSNKVFKVLEDLSELFSLQPPVFSKDLHSHVYSNAKSNTVSLSDSNRGSEAEIRINGLAVNPTHRKYQDTQPDILDHDPILLQSSQQQNKRNYSVNTLSERINEMFSKDVQPSLADHANRLDHINTTIKVVSDLFQADYRELDSLNDQIKINSNAISKSITESEQIINKANSTEVLSLDRDIVSKNVLFSQLYNIVCEEKAMDDSLSAIEKARSNNVISSQSFIKISRSIGRDQFLKRATIIAIQKNLGWDS